MESHPENIAYEVSDCGLVVGRIHQNGRSEAFVFASRARFGMHANQLVILPNPIGAGAAALDINEHGVIVGTVGGSDAASLVNERAAIWRRTTASSPFSVGLILPPPDSAFRDYDLGGFGRLAAVSTDGDEVWATGHFRLDVDCGSGPFAAARLGAVAVRLTGSTPGPDDYRWDSPTSGTSQGYGIARAAEFIGGARRSCDQTASCGLATGDRAYAWSFDATAPAMSAQDRHSDPEPLTSDVGRSVIHAILGDGASVGAMADPWLDGNCRQVACAWAPGSAPLASILPPSSPQEHVKGSVAHDLELSTFAHQGIVPGRFAVGTRFVHGGTVGVLWFRDEAQGSNWASTSWIDRLPSDMVSCPDVHLHGEPPRCVRITALHGVNRRGDLAGQIEVGGEMHAVLLRAVPMACAGDVNHDGSVNAADLAILLGAWCGTAVVCPPLEYSDFNVDGRVDATDLALVLDHWGPTPCLDDCGNEEFFVAAAVRNEAQAVLDFSLQYAGVMNLDFYRSWAESVPAEVRTLVDQMIWETAKQLVE